MQSTDVPSSRMCLDLPLNTEIAENDDSIDLHTTFEETFPRQVRSPRAPTPAPLALTSEDCNVSMEIEQVTGVRESCCENVNVPNTDSNLYPVINKEVHPARAPSRPFSRLKSIQLVKPKPATSEHVQTLPHTSHNSGKSVSSMGKALSEPSNPISLIPNGSICALQMDTKPATGASESAKQAVSSVHRSLDENAESGQLNAAKSEVISAPFPKSVPVRENGSNEAENAGVRDWPVCKFSKRPRSAKAQRQSYRVIKKHCRGKRGGARRLVTSSEEELDDEITSQSDGENVELLDSFGKQVSIKLRRNQKSEDSEGEEEVGGELRQGARQRGTPHKLYAHLPNAGEVKAGVKKTVRQQPPVTGVRVFDDFSSDSDVSAEDDEAESPRAVVPKKLTLKGAAPLSSVKAPKLDGILSSKTKPLDALNATECEILDVHMSADDKVPNEEWRASRGGGVRQGGRGRSVDQELGLRARRGMRRGRGGRRASSNMQQFNEAEAVPVQVDGGAAAKNLDQEVELKTGLKGARVRNSVRGGGKSRCTQGRFGPRGSNCKLETRDEDAQHTAAVVTTLAMVTGGAVRKTELATALPSWPMRPKRAAAEQGLENIRKSLALEKEPFPRDRARSVTPELAQNPVGSDGESDEISLRARQARKSTGSVSKGTSGPARTAAEEGTKKVARKRSISVNRGMLQAPGHEVTHEGDKKVDLNSEVVALDPPPWKKLWTEEGEVWKGHISWGTYSAKVKLFDGPIEDPNRAQVTKSCHFCQCQHITSECRQPNCIKSYCTKCMRMHFPKETRETMAASCPRCRGFCNCKACLRQEFDLRLPTYSPVQEALLQEHVLSLAGPFVAKLVAQEDEEAAELGANGVYDAAHHSMGKNRVVCDRCATSIPNLHRTCKQCKWDLCLDCCADLRAVQERAEGSLLTSPASTSTSPAPAVAPACSMPGTPSRRLSLRCLRCEERPKMQLERFFDDDMMRDLRSVAEEYGRVKKDVPLDWRSYASESVPNRQQPKTLHDGSSSVRKIKVWGRTLPETDVRLAANRPDIGQQYIFTPSATDLVPGSRRFLECAPLFMERWAAGEPIVVRNVSPRVSWTPETMMRACRELGSQRFKTKDMEDTQLEVLDCDGFKLETMTQQRFFNGYASGCPDKDEKPRMLKVKDWPPQQDFKVRLVRHNQDFMEMLPMPMMVLPRASPLNMAASMPEFSNPTDLGPKTYVAYGQIEETLSEGDSVTKMHQDMSDAVNVLLHAHMNEEEKAQVRCGTAPAEMKRYGNAGAVWDLWRRQDTLTLRGYLKKHAHEFIHHAKHVTHYVHEVFDQCFMLNSEHRKAMQAECGGVESWHFEQHVHEAVFIPAGCPHQVRNLRSCIKVAVDFVSPESAHEVLSMSEQLRQAHFTVEASKQGECSGTPRSTSAQKKVARPKSEFRIEGTGSEHAPENVDGFKAVSAQIEADRAEAGNRAESIKVEHPAEGVNTVKAASVQKASMEGKVEIAVAENMLNGVNGLKGERVLQEVNDTRIVVTGRETIPSAKKVRQMCELMGMEEPKLSNMSSLQSAQTLLGTTPMETEQMLMQQAQAGSEADKATLLANPSEGQRDMMHGRDHNSGRLQQQQQQNRIEGQVNMVLGHVWSGGLLQQQQQQQQREGQVEMLLSDEEHDGLQQQQPGRQLGHDVDMILDHQEIGGTLQQQQQQQYHQNHKYHNDLMIEAPELATERAGVGEAHRKTVVLGSRNDVVAAMDLDMPEMACDREVTEDAGVALVQALDEESEGMNKVAGVSLGSVLGFRSCGPIIADGEMCGEEFAVGGSAPTATAPVAGNDFPSAGGTSREEFTVSDSALTAAATAAAIDVPTTHTASKAVVSATAGVSKPSTKEQDAEFGAKAGELRMLEGTAAASTGEVLAPCNPGMEQTADEMRSGVEQGQTEVEEAVHVSNEAPGLETGTQDHAHCSAMPTKFAHEVTLEISPSNMGVNNVPCTSGGESELTDPTERPSGATGAASMPYEVPLASSRPPMEGGNVPCSSDAQIKRGITPDMRIGHDAHVVGRLCPVMAADGLTAEEHGRGLSSAEAAPEPPEVRTASGPSAMEIEEEDVPCTSGAETGGAVTNDKERIGHDAPLLPNEFLVSPTNGPTALVKRCDSTSTQAAEMEANEGTLGHGEIDPLAVVAVNLHPDAAPSRPVRVPSNVSLPSLPETDPIQAGSPHTRSISPFSLKQHVLQMVTSPVHAISPSLTSPDRTDPFQAASTPPTTTVPFQAESPPTCPTSPSPLEPHALQAVSPVSRAISPMSSDLRSPHPFRSVSPNSRPTSPPVPCHRVTIASPSPAPLSFSEIGAEGTSLAEAVVSQMESIQTVGAKPEDPAILEHAHVEYEADVQDPNASSLSLDPSSLFIDTAQALTVHRTYGLTMRAQCSACVLNGERPSTSAEVGFSGLCCGQSEGQVGRNEVFKEEATARVTLQQYLRRGEQDYGKHSHGYPCTEVPSTCPEAEDASTKNERLLSQYNDYREEGMSALGDTGGFGVMPVVVSGGMEEHGIGGSCSAVSGAGMLCSTAEEETNDRIGGAAMKVSTVSAEDAVEEGKRLAQCEGRLGISTAEVPAMEVDVFAEDVERGVNGTASSDDAGTTKLPTSAAVRVEHLDVCATAAANSDRGAEDASRSCYGVGICCVPCSSPREVEGNEVCSISGSGRVLTRQDEQQCISAQMQHAGGKKHQVLGLSLGDGRGIKMHEELIDGADALTQDDATMHQGYQGAKLGHLSTTGEDVSVRAMKTENAMLDCITYESLREQQRQLRSSVVTSGSGGNEACKKLEETVDLTADTFPLQQQQQESKVAAPSKQVGATRGRLQHNARLVVASRNSLPSRSRKQSDSDFMSVKDTGCQCDAKEIEREMIKKQRGAKVVAGRAAAAARREAEAAARTKVTSMTAAAPAASNVATSLTAAAQTTAAEATAAEQAMKKPKRELEMLASTTGPADFPVRARERITPVPVQKSPEPALPVLMPLKREATIKEEEKQGSPKASGNKRRSLSRPPSRSRSRADEETQQLAASAAAKEEEEVKVEDAGEDEGGSDACDSVYTDKLQGQLIILSAAARAYRVLHPEKENNGLQSKKCADKRG